MSLPYSEFPVYIGQAGVGSSTPPNEINDYLPVTQASVSYNTASSVRRKLGKSVDADQFVFDGALSADISVSCLLQSGMLSGWIFYWMLIKMILWL